MNTKTCTICKEIKSITEFYIRHDRNKPISRCNHCNAELSKKWRQGMSDEQRRKRNAASAKSYLKHAQNGNIRPIIKHKLSGFRGTAKNKNIPFDLDVDYLVNLFENQNGLCYYTGEKLELSSGLGTSRVTINNRPYQFSLDRLIPELGYVKGNVVWCGWIINLAKTSFTENGFYHLCQKILEYRKNRS